jgi:16S rRNA (guanine527-N7)-methyltransferase
VFHVKHEGSIRDAAAALRVDLSADDAARLAAYEDLLRRHAVPLGLVSAGDAHRLRERHVLDCLRAVPLLSRKARTLADLGSGAGLPGVVLAIARPDLSVSLVEPRRRAVAFLELVADALELGGVSILPRRAEAVEARFDVVTARALAPAARSWALAERLLASGGRVLYWAGARFDPAGVDAAVRLVPASALARAGPLAIMGRQ